MSLTLYLVWMVLESRRRTCRYNGLELYTFCGIYTVSAWSAFFEVMTISSPHLTFTTREESEGIEEV